MKTNIVSLVLVSYHENIVKVINHIQESNKRSASCWTNSKECLVDVKAERSAVSKIMPLKILYDETEPTIFIISWTEVYK